VKIRNIELSSPFAVAPMAGMTDTAFRRLVKRHGGCGLVVTEMVSSEGLVRGIDRTLEYAEYTEEERPISVQIFGGDPEKMAAAARVVEQLGADIVDVNMGCPVPKIAKHNAGCSLMREPSHAAEVIAAMAKAVSIPVTVKMRAGWNDSEKNALLGCAAALLLPIEWEEPFPVVLPEALLCGTPVLAFRRGGVPEGIDEGLTGFVCDTSEQMMTAVCRLGELDRAECRAAAERRFSTQAIVDEYEHLYLRLCAS